MRSREEDKEKRRRDALRRIAPGFEPMGGPLVPTKTNEGPAAHHDEQSDNGPHPKSVMEDLVDQLAALESSHS